jgi:hypothetical protein
MEVPQYNGDRVGWGCGMKWFRLYHDLPNDRKLIKFSVQQKWAWVVILCLASESKTRGIVIGEDESDIADYCGFDSTQDYLYFLDKLRQKDMIEPIEGGFKITHWDERQYIKPSDLPEATKERKRKQRSNQKESLDNMSRVTSRDDGVTSRHTDTDPYSDPETESEEKNKNLDLNIDPPVSKGDSSSISPLGDPPPKKTRVVKPKVDDAVFQVFQDSYNQNRPSSWAKCQSLNKERVNALKALWKQYGENTLEVFEQALAYLREDKWHSTRDFGIDYLLGKGRVTTYSERAASSSVGNPEAKKAAIFLKLQSSFNDEARVA